MNKTKSQNSITFKTSFGKKRIGKFKKSRGPKEKLVSKYRGQGR
jgi:hypothetical protein